MRNALVVLILVPMLLAGQTDQLPESVRALLRKPRGGGARLTFRDGTQSDGMILRVTDQFVSFTEGSPPNRLNQHCEDIDLALIANVAALHSPDDESAWPYLVVATPLLAPFVILTPFAMISESIRDAHAHRGLPSGSWESVSADAAGHTRHVEFHDVYIAMPDQVVKQGRYHLDGDELHFDYDKGAEESVPVRFECDTLVADRPDGRLYLSTPQWEGRAYSPIVGHWWMRNRGTRVNWDLRPDGTFRIQNIENDNWARMEPIEGGIKVSWSGEEWKIRHAHNHLLVTKDGVELEYKHAPPVR
jgi:hypothetical protein